MDMNFRTQTHWPSEHKFKQKQRLLNALFLFFVFLIRITSDQVVLDVLRFLL